MAVRTAKHDFFAVYLYLLLSCVIDIGFFDFPKSDSLAYRLHSISLIVQKLDQQQIQVWRICKPFFRIGDRLTARNGYAGIIRFLRCRCLCLWHIYSYAKRVVPDFCLPVRLIQLRRYCITGSLGFLRAKVPDTSVQSQRRVPVRAVQIGFDKHVPNLHLIL